MKPVLDKTEQLMREQFDKLDDIETATNKRDVREARRRLKQQMHKHARNVGKRQLRERLEDSDS